MISYEGSIWRPPSEARSLILQATVGCSHNACTFCVSYKKKTYRVRGAKGLETDLLQLTPTYRERVRRVFLADGNALAMDVGDWRESLDLLYREIPNLERVSTYGYAKDVRNKSVEDLRQLRESGMGIIYLGLETGDDDLLRWVRKGVTSEENIEACRKIREAGLPLSITIILGLGGLEKSDTHAKVTADVLNEIDPEYVGALTMMTPPGTPIHDLVQKKEFIPMQPLEILRELRTLVAHLELSNCVFRTNHASNYLPIRGMMSKDKDSLLEIIDSVLESEDQSILRPGYMRGL